MQGVQRRQHPQARVRQRSRCMDCGGSSVLRARPVPYKGLQRVRRRQPPCRHMHMHMHMHMYEYMHMHMYEYM